MSHFKIPEKNSNRVVDFNEGKLRALTYFIFKLVIIDHLEN